MSDKVTFASLSRDITTEAEAYSFFEELRWGDSPTCAHCASAKDGNKKSGDGGFRLCDFCDTKNKTGHF